MGWFNQRQSQKEIDEQHARYEQDLARQAEEERTRFRRGEAFKRYQYEQEQLGQQPAPAPRKRGR
jgi:hypothetical protein